MSKLIRLKETTFQELIKYGKYSDTMDTIVSTLLKKMTGFKELKN